MNMLKLCVPALGLLAATNAVQAADLELALSGESAAAELFMDSSSLASGGADIRFGLLFNEDDDLVGSLGLVVRGTPAGQQPYSFGLGAQIYMASVDSLDEGLTALALGGGVKYYIPANMPIALGGELFFAPSITTTGDGDSFLDFRVRAEVELLPSATAFVGYRSLSSEFDGDVDDYDIDDNLHLGIRLQF